MDLNDLRTAVMLAGFALFVALLRHTWSRQRLSEHAAAAALPFIDDDAQATAAARQTAAGRTTAPQERGEPL